MTPTIITLDACWVMRVTVVKIEIPSMAAINAAGAITKGISLVNQMSVCIFFFLVNDSCYAGNRVNIVIQPDISTRQSKMARRTKLATMYVTKSNVLIWFMVRCALIDSGGSELWVANSRDDDPIWFQFCTHTQFCEECAIIYILHIVCQADNTTIYIKTDKIHIRLYHCISGMIPESFFKTFGCTNLNVSDIESCFIN